MADVSSYIIGLSLAGDNLGAPANDIQFVGAFPFYFDGANWDRVRGDATDGLLVNLGANNDVDTELPAAAVLADATGNPTVPGVGAFLMGFNGTTWDRVRTANTGRLQVDVITGGGTDTPTSPVNTYVTSAALAAGASANLDTGELGAVKLAQVETFSSVAYKALVYKIENGVASAIQAIGGHMQGGAWSWKPPHRNYMAISASAGVDGFRVAVTNLDDSNAADVYATFHTEN